MNKKLTRICASSPDGRRYGWPSLEELAKTGPMVFSQNGKGVVELGNYSRVKPRFFGFQYVMSTSTGKSITLYYYRDDSDGKLWLGLPRGYFFGEEAFSPAI